MHSAHRETNFDENAVNILLSQQNAPKMRATLPKAMPNLQKISAKNGKLATLEGFPESAPNLANINVEKNHLRNLSFLPADARKIEELRVNGNQLKTLQGLPATKDLVFMDVSNNNLETFTGVLHQQPELKYLIAKSNKLNSLASVPQSKQLGVVNVSHNNLSTLEGLPGMHPIELKLPTETKIVPPYVNFCDNPLTSLKGLPLQAFVHSIYEFEHCVDQTKIDDHGKNLLHECAKEAENIEPKHRLSIKSTSCQKAWHYFNP